MIRKEKLISWIGSWLIRALGLTLRIRFKDESGFLDGTLPAPTIFCFWHNRLLVMPIIHSWHYNRKKASVLTSASRDGTLLAEFMARFNMGAVRGSSSRRGASAVRELNELLDRGEDIIITPDGPRGPCYRLGAGPVFLAQKTGLPLVPIHIEYDRCIRIKSWDRFMIPLPFSRVKVTLGAPEYIPQTGSDETFEAERARIEKLMQPENL